MADVLRRLVGPVNMPTASSNQYAVVTGGTTTYTTIRNIHVLNTTAGSLTFNLSINAAATVATACIYYQFYVAPLTAFDWSGTLVLHANDTLGIMASATGLTLTISGVESTP